jgi:diacylglycerol O-acyltransferase-1
MSRQTLARRILSGRSPKDFTSSGHRIDQLDESTVRNGAKHLKNNNLGVSEGVSQSQPIENSIRGKTKFGKGGSNAVGAKGPRTFPAYKPMHIECLSSPLSSENKPGHYNYRGFFNLGLIILVLSHFELIINNMAKYGLQIGLTFASISSPDDQEGSISLILFLGALRSVGSWMASILLSFSLEKLAINSKFPDKYFLFLKALLVIVNIVVPCLWVWKSTAHPVANMIYLFQSVVIWMKLISYLHANFDLRKANKRAKKIDKDQSSKSGYSSCDELSFDNNAKPVNFSENLHLVFSEVKDLQPPYLLYPQNITFSNIMYFMLAPTLCYQLNYPRTTSTNWHKVLSLLFRICFVGAMIIFSIEQYIKPTLEISLIPMQDMDILSIIGMLLKLSIPNTYVWLLGFYLYFHLWLNLLAELTRFGDRQFYKDWWNARTIDRYWFLILIFSIDVFVLIT